MTTYLSPIISAIIAGVVSFIVSTRNNRAQQRATIDAMLLKSIELAMQYPHVEDDEYAKKWPGIPDGPDKKGQYECFCCFSFNLLEKAWEFSWAWWRIASWRRQVVKKLVPVEEIVATHRCWWDKERDNLFGYPDDFRAFIKLIIDELDKNGGKR